MPHELTVGSLFAGIGGFDLGLERAGMRSVWQSEIDPYCQRVLEKHWPDVLRVPDVRDVGAGTVPYVDVICGGFPCQDISSAGAKAGIGGARSGLWSEYARVIRELRPRYVIVENVAALLGRGLGTVLADMAACGLNAEWDCVPASAVGAPHRRDRLWIVGYPNDEGQPTVPVDAEAPRMPRVGHAPSVPRDAASDPRSREHQGRQRPSAARGSGRAIGRSPWWDVEPDLDRVAHGIPARMERLHALGNSLVPQVAELIGRRIVAYEAERVRAA